MELISMQLSTDTVWPGQHEVGLGLFRHWWAIASVKVRVFSKPGLEQNEGRIRSNMRKAVSHLGKNVGLPI